MGKTSIQWTDHSVNPFRARQGGSVGHYCRKVSPGCANCYASRLQTRFGMPEFKGETSPLGTVEVFLDESKLQDVLRRKKPTRYFWWDMTDAFLDVYPDEWLDQCFAVMAATPWHTHQVLTKRAERMQGYLSRDGYHMRLAAELAHLGPTLDTIKGDWSMWSPTIFGLRNKRPDAWPLPNVWLGVSVEDQQRADERIPHLLRTPAAVRFLSCEPLLGAVDLRPKAPDTYAILGKFYSTGVFDPSGMSPAADRVLNCFPKIDWAIVGGESGRGARPCELDHVRSIVEQCKAARVACFVKQLGSDPVGDDTEAAWSKSSGTRFALRTILLRDPKGGDIEEFPPDLRVREFPV